ncbi:MAG: transcriptional regulator [Firmicutes bacterium]|nr:transcriptional regulator [Bacillota bacterium]
MDNPRLYPIGDILHNTDINFSNLLSARFKEFDVTPEQWLLLHSLSANDGINQKELSARVGKNQTIVTRMLDILERKGCVERKPAPADRRAFLVCITDKGLELQKQLLAVEEKTVKAVLKDILPEKLDTFIQICNKINESTEGIIREFKNHKVSCPRFE